MWILLIAFQTANFALAMESGEQCQEMARISVAYAESTGQSMQAMCMRTLEV